MNVSVSPSAVPAHTGRGRTAFVARRADRAGLDSWPHTTRLLPWAIAGFLFMLVLIPFDAVSVPVNLPVDSTLDRALLPVVVGLWASWFLVGRAREALRARPTIIDVAIVLLLTTAVLSVVLNAQTLIVVDEFTISTKKLAILASWVLFFYVVTTGLRTSELAAFATLTVVLAAAAGAGVLYEYRSGVNVFYDWTAKLLPPSFPVRAAPADPEFGRESVTGPTSHAIAIATLLAMSLPFALTGFMRSATTRNRILHGLAITLILAGCIATVRRTGALGPAAALITLVIYRPRQMFRLLPLGLFVVLATQVLAPNAPSRVKAQFVDLFSDNSVQGRTSDYDPVTPDVRNELIIGRGFGSYDPSHHRFLDNEWLGRVIETGIIGALAYLFLILAIVFVAHRASRSRDPVRRAVGVSVVAGAAVYATTNAVFDALAFPQAPYMLFFLAALAAVAADVGDEDLSRQLPLSAASRPRQRSAAWPRATITRDADDRPDLSIVLVTHNGVGRGASALASAQRATGAASTEWLVVDCGSTDGTPELIASRYNNVTLIRERNLGFAGGANQALSRARGRYVLLLNPDVEVVSGELSDLVAALDSRPEVAAASVVQTAPGGVLQPSIGRDPSVLRQLGEALRIRSLSELDARTGRYRSERSADWLPGSFLVLRGDAIRDIGRLDERFFLYCEEKDWCYRARRAGWDVRHLPVMTVEHDSPGYLDPGRRAQLSYAKLQFARKHMSLPRRFALRTALGAGHALRLAGMAPAALFSRRARERLRGERRALAVALGRPPRFPDVSQR